MRRLDTLGHLEIVASQAHGVRARTTVTDEEADVAAWTVVSAGDDGRITVKVGGATAIALALAVGRGARWPLVPWRAPLRHIGMPWLLARVYGLIAANRHRLPGDTPWCEAHPGECSDAPAR